MCVAWGNVVICHGSTKINVNKDETKGAFSHSAGTAPIIAVMIQVTTLKTTHLRNHAQ